MNCSSCGNVLSDGSVFCEFCGAALRSAPSVVSSGAGAAAIATLPSPPSAAAIAELSGRLIKSFSLGEKLAAGGAVAAALGFFLPWLSGPDLRSLGNLQTLLGQTGIGSTTYSGFDAAKVWGAIYLVLGAAIASGVLFLVASKATTSKKLTVSGFQVMIGSIVGPWLVFALLFIPFMQSVAGMGLWLTGLGFCAVAAGGLVTIGQLARTA